MPEPITQLQFKEGIQRAVDAGAVAALPFTYLLMLKLRADVSPKLRNYADSVTKAIARWRDIDELNAKTAQQIDKEFVVELQRIADTL